MTCSGVFNLKLEKEREFDRVRQSNGEADRERGRRIPWLRGRCGILGLVERSSSPGHVCFGRLCKGEICSSSLPAFALLQQQTIQWGTTAAPSHTMSQQLLSPTATSRSSQSQLLSDYHRRAQQSESLWSCDNDFIFFSLRISPEIIVSKLTTVMQMRLVYFVTMLWPGDEWLWLVWFRLSRYLSLWHTGHESE